MLSTTPLTDGLSDKTKYHRCSLTVSEFFGSFFIGRSFKLVAAQEDDEDDVHEMTMSGAMKRRMRWRFQRGKKAIHDVRCS